MSTSTHFVNKASTNVTIYVDIIQDAGATTPGDPLTGLAYTDMTIYYHRPLAASVALTAATQTVTGIHADGGFVEQDGTNQPGHYRVDLSDAICATGANDAWVTLTSTNSAPHTAHIVLTDVAPEVTVSGTQTFDITGSITGNLSGSVGSVTGAVGSVTGNVGGSVASVTGAVGSVTGSVGSVVGHTPQTGDTFAQLPTNFADMKIEVTTGIVDSNVQKINDVAIIGDGSITPFTV